MSVAKIVFILKESVKKHRDILNLYEHQTLISISSTKEDILHCPTERKKENSYMTFSRHWKVTQLEGSETGL